MVSDLILNGVPLTSTQGDFGVGSGVGSGPGTLYLYALGKGRGSGAGEFTHYGLGYGLAPGASFGAVEVSIAPEEEVVIWSLT